MTIVSRAWNLDRVVIREDAEGRLTIRARRQGKSIEAEIHDRTLAQKLGEPTTVESEGRL